MSSDLPKKFSPLKNLRGSLKSILCSFTPKQVTSANCTEFRNEIWFQTPEFFLDNLSPKSATPSKQKLFQAILPRLRVSL